ncbi:MAG: hypothetical protein NXI04_24340 [Planctomycetaceae bacterium]|nr:hypothetical protein [Planctomycetaceae bacterium]
MAEPQKKFARVGNLFAFNGLGLREGGRLYFGNVIVSEDAMYLISGYASLRLRIMVLLLRPFVFGEDRERREVDRQVFDVPLEELDTDVTSHPHWPLQLDGGATPFHVRVLNRFNEASALAEVSASAHWFSLGVTVRCGPDRVWIRCSPFGRRQILQTLAAFGWSSRDGMSRDGMPRGKASVN